MDKITEVVTIKKRSSKQEKFDKRVIKKIVGLIESGMLQKDAAATYGINTGTISLWLNKYGSASFQATRRKVYTMAEKRSVVRAVRGGMRIADAKRAFNISYSSVINKWLKELDGENSEISISKTTDMSKKLKETPNAEILALQKALEEANFKVKALDTLIDIAEEKLNINIRKKSGAKQSPK